MNVNNHKFITWGDIHDSVYTVVYELLKQVKQKDLYTYQHCLRVGSYSRKLASSMGLDEFHQRAAELGGLLHDIGKIGVDQKIVHKPSKLTDDEFKSMREHPDLSAEMIEKQKTNFNKNFLDYIIPVVRYHHERVDGKGYPHKVENQDIPLLSRVILVVDTLDAMKEDRPYRRGMPIEIIIRELKRCSGTQFDSQIVKAFVESYFSWDEKVDRETTAKILNPLKAA